jgi:hypothetical protein
MDAPTEFVNQFCHKVAQMAKGYRQMAAWYVFHDTRPGDLKTRFETDAADHMAYTKLFQA